MRLRVEGDAAQRFDWLLNTLPGPQADDPPLGRRLGTQGINLLIKRVQDALTARGFVTSRILAELQDIKSGELTLTVLPGRLRAVRFASADGGTSRFKLGTLDANLNPPFLAAGQKLKYNALARVQANRKASSHHHHGMCQSELQLLILI